MSMNAEGHNTLNPDQDHLRTQSQLDADSLILKLQGLSVTDPAAVHSKGQSQKTTDSASPEGIHGFIAKSPSQGSRVEYPQLPIDPDDPYYDNDEQWLEDHNGGPENAGQGRESGSSFNVEEHVISAHSCNASQSSHANALSHQTPIEYPQLPDMTDDPYDYSNYDTFDHGPQGNAVRVGQSASSFNAERRAMPAQSHNRMRSDYPDYRSGTVPQYPQPYPQYNSPYQQHSSYGYPS
nr:uncharacterized protein CI109_003579 [Kwoniella shandongensis]KAA5527926.1 hypothetical protein CI109_003579 [Kwoniella shandongensis]